jgi:hypothetical protein
VAKKRRWPTTRPTGSKTGSESSGPKRPEQTRIYFTINKDDGEEQKYYYRLSMTREEAERLHRELGRRLGK